MMLIRVGTLAEPIEEVVPMPNWTFTWPAVEVSSIMFSIFWSAWNWPYPAVDFLEAPVSIIIPIKILELYRVSLAEVVVAL
jgi:hypothetical protein